MSRMSLLTCANPPTSSHETFGILGAPMLSEYAARAVSSADSKSCAVSGMVANARSCAVGVGKGGALSDSEEGCFRFSFNSALSEKIHVLGQSVGGFAITHSSRRTLLSASSRAPLTR